MSGKIIIGVTGEIGAGKTTFVKELESFGAYPIYADEIAHKILDLPQVQLKLESHFGKSIFENGKINPKKLASLAFKSKENWLKLISCTHPYILKRVFRILKKCKQRYIAIDAPLLFESGLEEVCNYIVVLKSEVELRKKRLKGLTWKELERRKIYLIPLRLKEKLADFVVSNNKDRRRLRENAQKIWIRIKEKRTKRRTA